MRSAEVSLHDSAGKFVLEPTTDDTAEDEIIHREDEQQIYSTVAAMPARDAWIVRRRFGLGGVPVRTRREIASELRVSRQRVEQIERRALLQIRAVLDPQTGGRTYVA